MKTCYIVGAGEFYGSFSPGPEDLVIAADGGYESLVARGIRCDILMGDLDSLKVVPEGVQTIRYPIEKDDTDTYLAFKKGLVMGYRRFRIFGGVGGRADHTFANYSLLLYGANLKCDTVLIGDGYHCRVLRNGAITLSGPVGGNLSVFAIGGKAHGVSISGAKYKAKDITLTPEFPLGVSNSFTDEECRIEVKRGSLLIMYRVK